MLKASMFSLLLLQSSLCLAAPKVGDTNPDNSGIITPAIAKGVRSYERFTNDTAGAMLVCRFDQYGYRGGCEKWTPIQFAVPAGTEYVGFRVVSGEYGRRQIEIYWK